MGKALLIINAGSSTVKWSVLDADCPTQSLLKAKVEIHFDKKKLTFYQDDVKLSNDSFKDYKDITTLILKTLQQCQETQDIIGMGHRIVHGGLKYHSCSQADDQVIQDIENLSILAPLHQRHALDYLKFFRSSFPNIPQFCHFDTAFHQSIPYHHRVFGLPQRLAEEGVIKYGFHGIAYESVVQHLKQRCPTEFPNKVVAIHLGSGCSMAALKNGKSFDTSMGFSTLDGLIMSTRSGSLDPGALLFMVNHYKMSYQEIENLLYHDSGIRGLSGISSDLRDIEYDSDLFNRVLNIFCHSAVKNLFSLIGVLGGVDAITFSGGIGENSSLVRKKIADRLTWLGLEMDEKANTSHASILTKPTSQIKAFLMSINEEQVIAFHIQQLLKRG